MHRWIALAVVLLLGSAAFALLNPAYTRYKPHELCLEADAIALGRIVALDQTHFEVEIRRQLAGEPLGARVRMPRFKNWTCAWRWAPYALDQELLLFLSRSESGQGYAPIGAGCEGEMPLLGEQVGLSGFRLRDVPQVLSHYGLHQVEVQLVPLAQLEAGIDFLRKRFDYTPGTHDRLGAIAPRITIEEIEAFAKSSPLARQLVEDAIASREWRGSAPDSGPQLPLEASERITFANGDESDVMHLALLGDVDGDGRPEALASLKDPRSLALVRISREGTLSLQPIALAEPELIHEFGACAPLGDLDHDGELDFVLRAGDERLVLLSVSRDGKSARGRQLGRSNSPDEAQRRTNGSFADALAPLGDFDGDGALDLAVLAETRATTSERASTTLAILSIAPSGEVVRVRRVPTPNDPTNDALWLSLAVPGDVDGDGVVDLAFGDSYGEPSEFQRGAFWILFLTRDGGVRESRKFDPRSVFLRQRVVDEERFARRLAAAGDLDGDSIPDLLASSETGVWSILLARDGSVRSLRRLRNAGDGALAQSPREHGATLQVKLGRAIACFPARPGERPTLLSSALLSTQRRAGLLALVCDADGALHLR